MKLVVIIVSQEITSQGDTALLSSLLSISINYVSNKLLAWPGTTCKINFSSRGILCSRVVFVQPCIIGVKSLQLCGAVTTNNKVVSLMGENRITTSGGH